MAINFSDLGGGGASKIEKTEIIKSTQSWTAPADVTSVEVILCGGGGGGSKSYGAGGDIRGGGGGSADFKIFSVTPSSSYTITIGAGGAGTASSGGVGSTGSTSSVGALFSVTGGVGGSGVGTYRGGAPAGRGGRGGSLSTASGVVIMPTRGIQQYGEGGGGVFESNTSFMGQASPVANHGTGGGGATSDSTAGAGSSGVAVIKYWSAL